MNVTIPCVCGRHDSDVVTLRDTLDLRSALTIRNAAIIAKSEDPDISAAAVLAMLSEQYLLLGIESWSLVDQIGKPIPVTQPEIRSRLLEQPLAAVAVANAADELYGTKVVLPLLQEASSSSPDGQTDASTSPTSGPSENPMPSSPSSITSIPTAATVTTSPSLVGASST